VAITISVSDVKRKAMIPSTSTTYDSAIDSLIDEMQPALEYSIHETYLDDTVNSGLQATLTLGMLEIIAGEFIEQMKRESGAAEEFSAGGVTIGPSKLSGAELIQQGAARLSPYLKASLPYWIDSAALNSSSDSEPVFAREEGVW